jgi:hypothetical protein
MPSRKPNGWAGILGNEDLSEEHDRTDPNVEAPAFGELGSEEETRIEVRPRLSLPRPQSEPPQKKKGAIEFAVPVDEIVQKLEPQRSEPREKAKRKRDEHKLFTKEVILTIIGGVLLLGGAFAYTHGGKDEDGELERPTPRSMLQAPGAQPQGQPPPVAPPPVAKPEPKVEPAAIVPAPPPPPPKRVKPAIPMLSILSNPSGARVEINGTIYGNTPLIQPSPPDVRSLSIRLLKDNYKPYEAILSPTEAGHFNLNATLEKR